MSTDLTVTHPLLSVRPDLGIDLVNTQRSDVVTGIVWAYPPTTSGQGWRMTPLG